MNQIRVCHLTSVHRAYDTRIFFKECKSLAKAGYHVSLVANHPKSEVIDGVHIIALQRKSDSRLLRMLFFTWRVFFAGLKTRSLIFHYHDPELFLVGVVLRLLGKKVIFDAHENIGRQIKAKHYLPLKFMWARLYSLIDWISAKLFFLILAENSYASIYSNWTKRYQVVLNMPDFEFLGPYRNDNRILGANEIQLYYVGGITFERGIETIVNALAKLKERGVKVFFHCVGPFEHSIMEKIKRLPNYEKVNHMIKFYGPMPLDKALVMSKSCHIGLSVLLPIENYLESYSTKVFEYMAIGIPVITSNFELYRNVVEKHQCGYCIDPSSPLELADSITSFVNSPSQINQMGIAGIEAAKAHYNWRFEEQKLLNTYKLLLA